LQHENFWGSRAGETLEGGEVKEQQEKQQQQEKHSRPEEKNPSEEHWEFKTIFVIRKE
jgi:hypothetical protein